MRLRPQASALPRLSARTVLLAVALSSTSIAGLQALHGTSHSHVATAGSATRTAVTATATSHGHAATASTAPTASSLPAASLALT